MVVAFHYLQSMDPAKQSDRHLPQHQIYRSRDTSVFLLSHPVWIHKSASNIFPTTEHAERSPKDVHVTMENNCV